MYAGVFELRNVFVPRGEQMQSGPTGDSSETSPYNKIGAELVLKFSSRTVTGALVDTMRS